MTKHLHATNGICLNQDGSHEAVTPLPFYRGILFLKRFQCLCGKSFWTEEKYRTHFRLENEKEWFMEEA